MTVRTQTATVYFGSRRRWLSLDAACRAEAKQRFKTDDSDEDFDTSVPQLAAEARAEFDQVASAAPATPESRTMGACRALVAAAPEVKRLSNLIGDAMSACHEAWYRLQSNNGWNAVGYTLHLETAYAFEVGEEGDRDYLSDAQKLEVLAACPHCLAAHNAIQERKAARRRLAAARRAITMIGKSK